MQTKANMFIMANKVAHFDSSCFGLFLLSNVAARQKFSSPSWTTVPIPFQGTSTYYNQHMPQYTFPYPTYRYAIQTCKLNLYLTNLSSNLSYSK